MKPFYCFEFSTDDTIKLREDNDIFFSDVFVVFDKESFFEECIKQKERTEDYEEIKADGKAYYFNEDKEKIVSDEELTKQAHEIIYGKEENEEMKNSEKTVETKEEKVETLANNRRLIVFNDENTTTMRLTESQLNLLSCLHDFDLLNCEYKIIMERYILEP